jgi:hypothetical protein
MLTNIYNEDSYIKDEDGKWDLSGELGDDYFRMPPDSSEQHTTCASF